MLRALFVLAFEQQAQELQKAYENTLKLMEKALPEIWTLDCQQSSLTSVSFLSHHLRSLPSLCSPQESRVEDNFCFALILAVGLPVSC